MSCSTHWTDRRKHCQKHCVQGNSINIIFNIEVILNHCFFNYWILIDEGTYTQYRINQNDEARDCGRAKIPSAMSHGVVLHRHADDPSLSSCRFQSRQPGGCSWGASSAAKIARGKINARASATPPHLSNLRAAPGAGVWATKRRKGATKREERGCHQRYKITPLFTESNKICHFFSSSQDNLPFF
jgi:hypothetical protein